MLLCKIGILAIWEIQLWLHNDRYIFSFSYLPVNCQGQHHHIDENDKGHRDKEKPNKDHAIWFHPALDLGHVRIAFKCHLISDN